MPDNERVPDDGEYVKGLTCGECDTTIIEHEVVQDGETFECPNCDAVYKVHWVGMESNIVDRQ